MLRAPNACDVVERGYVGRAKPCSTVGVHGDVYQWNIMSDVDARCLRCCDI